jgi:hypothetical protein
VGKVRWTRSFRRSAKSFPIKSALAFDLQNRARIQPDRPDHLVAAEVWLEAKDAPGFGLSIRGKIWGRLFSNENSEHLSEAEVQSVIRVSMRSCS